jgi:signal peptide peptidase SppA
MNTEIWLGSENNYREVEINLAKIELASASNFDPADYGLLSVHEGVGVISISGSLVTEAPAFAAMFGVIGYNVIKDTLITAAQDPEIKQILLNVDSPGGSAMGISSVAALIQKISSEHKPITGFVENQACSAGYWLLSSTDTVHAERLATVGSIGCIAISMQYVGRMEQDGVTATVIRSTSRKAMGSPYEVLSAEAKAEIQSKIDTLYMEFKTNISQLRGLSMDTADIWGNGSTQLGFEALPLGLVDKITTFEELTSSLVKKVSASSKDSGRMNLSTEGNCMARKNVLSDKSAALLAAGVSLEAALDAEDEVIEQDVVEPEDVQDPEPEAPAPAPVEASDFFKAQLAESNEKMISLMLDNREMKSKLETIDVTHTQLRAIAADSINLRNVGLGRGRVDLATASDEVILSTYSNISKEFNNTFAVGSLTELASTEKEKVTMSAAQKRAVGATKI